MLVDRKDITVVIQGPIDWSVTKKFARPTTLVLTRSLRRLLPDARIVLSTWQGQRVEGLDYDTVIFSPDPQAQGAWPSYTPNNVNRQIISTVAGLKAATTTFALKIRTDLVLTGVEFLNIFEALKPLGGSEDLFDYPVLANNLTSRKTSAVVARIPDQPLPFHPADHFHFGLRTDLLRLWDVPLQTEEDAFFFMDITQPNRWRGHELSRLAPEQHLLTNALRKKMPIDILHYADARPDVIAMSDYIMSTNFCFVPDRQLPIYFEKYHTPHHYSFEWMRHDHAGRPAPPPPKKGLAAKIDKIRQQFHLP